MTEHSPMDLEAWDKYAQKQRKAANQFLQELGESSLHGVKPVAKQAEREVWEEINCMRCANCCKKMTPTLRKKDRERIAAHLNIKVKAFENDYLVYIKKDKDWHMNGQPCFFLNKETNACTIYDVRPKDCRKFPHLLKWPIPHYVHVHRQNIDYCPATLLFVQKLMDRIEIK